MRISGLAAAAGVPVATVKYYLREGLLQPGRALSRTQAEYDESHVERVRLVRALTEVGGLSLATVGRVLRTIEAPDVEHVGVMATAQRSLLGADYVGTGEQSRTARAPGAHGEGRGDEQGEDRVDAACADLGPGARPSRSREFLLAHGWQVHGDDPVLEQLDAAWAACDEAGIGLDEARMAVYADAALTVARVDVASVPDEPQAAVRQVVLGTVLVDPVLAALRRLAQQHVSVSEGVGR